ncbi:hypothetical protein Tco_1473996 [Tanacetum coccineum]
MESEKYLEGQSMQRPPLFESNGFIYWKNRFETYVKSKDLDLWHIITDGDFPPIQNNPETKKDEIVPFHKQNDDLKKKLAKNNEAKMVIYNALPRKEYERIFMCQTAKEIWDTLLITHQAVDGTAWIFLTPSLHMILLYGDDDLTTTKFIIVEVKCSASPIFTGSNICPIGYMISPLKPMRGAVAGIIWLFTSRRSLLKQCSYSISEVDPPSTYIRCMKCPPIFASVIIGPSVLSLSLKGGNEISGLGEKLCVTFCLATLCHG